MTDGVFVAFHARSSGRATGDHFVTDIGAVAVSAKTCLPISSFASFLRQPPDTGWEDECVVEFWSRKQELWGAVKAGVKAAPSHSQVRLDFHAWLRGVAPEPHRATLCFDSAGYDGSWMDWFLRHTSCLYVLGGGYDAPVDLHSFARGVARINPGEKNVDPVDAAYAALGAKRPAHFYYDGDPLALATAVATDMANLASLVK